MISPHHPSDRRWAWAIFIVAFLVLLFAESSVGFTRDESVYFAAAESYAEWFQQLVTSPREALSDAAITRAFDFNHEHPVLLKNLFGLSHLVFHKTLHLVRSATAFRLPAFAFAALIPALLFLWTSALFGRRAGAFAASSFLLVPRHFFNAELACFDMPVAAMWLWVAYNFWRALSSSRYWLWTGVSFGLALATKHNAFFLPLVLLPFALWQGFTSSRKNPEALQWFGAWVGVSIGACLLLGFQMAAVGADAFVASLNWLSPQTALLLLFVFSNVYILKQLHRLSPETFRALAALSSMVILGPILFYLHWPYLWHQPVSRTLWYLAFHAQHNHYAWFYLGKLLREPPFPLSYVLVKTALTVPSSLFVPMVVGTVSMVGQAVTALRGRLPSSPQALPTWTMWFLLAHATTSIAIISHPQVPHFGGVKHWLPSMPFLCLFAGASVSRLSQTLSDWLHSLRSRVSPNGVFATVTALLLLPAAIASARVFPYGTASYSELAGGVAGAASLGMQRQFWSSHVTAVLPWLNANAPRGARVYLHEVNGFSFRDYQRNDMLRNDLVYAHGPADASIAVYQYHQEFREQEFNIWQEFGTTVPIYGFYLDGTPQVIVYQRPH